MAAQLGARVSVALVRESAPRPVAASLRCPEDIAAWARNVAGMGDLDREHFVAVHLDIKNRVRSWEIVSIGHLSAALVHPREVFKAAILANAASVALLHNHPSGDPEPSREDIDLTRRLIRAGELLGIPVLDHVVVTADRHCSVVERMIPTGREY